MGDPQPVGVEERSASRDALRGIPALIVRSGESRRRYPLAEVRTDVRGFGCNALYRDHTPEYSAPSTS